MKNKILLAIISAFSLGTTFLMSAPGKTYSAEQIAAESKRANEFFDKNFDEVEKRLRFRSA